VLAAAAADAGHDVTLCVRTPFERLLLENDGESREVPVTLATEPGVLGEVDWILLTTKVQDVPSTAPWLEKLATESTPLVVVQNGVEHRESVAAMGLPAPVLPALIYVAAERVAPGRIVCRSRSKLVTEDNELGARFRALLGTTSANISLTTDFRTEAWRKMLVNLAANPITALTLRRLDVLREPDILELSKKVLAEAIAVAQAEGAQLTQADADRLIDNYSRMFPTDNGTSMLYDRLAGLPTEHEHITGPLVRAAREHGIPVPHNETLLALMRALRPMRLPRV